MKLIVYTDGASRGNPGPASYGFTISDNSGKLLYEEGKFIGVATNNIAEYSAVLEALKYIKQNFKADDLTLEFFADSKLVVEQLSGRYKIKSPHLWPLTQEIKLLSLELGGVIHAHVPREKNTEADRLANQALDSR